MFFLRQPKADLMKAVSPTGGADNSIEVFLTNKDGIVNLNNHHHYKRFYFSGRVTNDSIKVVLPTGSDTYYLVFDNSFALMIPRAVQAKAHRLRMFWQKEDNKLVGKLLNELLDYLGETNPKTEICRLIVARLLGQQTQAPLDQPLPQIPVAKALTGLKEEFFQLAAEKDRNKAGLACEGLVAPCGSS